jgi:hypothetical protein
MPLAIFGEQIPLVVANGTANFTGALSFLNTWTYKLGAEVLVPAGHKELFDSGVRFLLRLWSIVEHIH